MTNSTGTHWDVDGVSLQQYAWNIRTLGGSRDSVPQWRGSDRVYAYKAGAQPRAMVADSRTITLLMWVIGMNPDGTVPADREEQYNANRRLLKRLFWKPGGELFDLTKRWREDGVIKEATARGRVSSNMEPEMMGPRGSRFAVDVFLPDPWFYGPQVETTLNKGVPVTIENDGDDVCRNIEVDFIGQLTSPVITNSTPTPDVWMKVGSAIAAGATVHVDVDDATVKRVADGANLIGSLTHSGSRSWMGLQRDTNSLLLTADAGAGHAVLRHRPAYF